MHKFAIKLVIYPHDNINIDEWFQYYISLGIKTYLIYIDTPDENITKNVIFYSKFVTIHINPLLNSDPLFTDLYILDLATDDFIYIPTNNTLIELLDYYKNTKHSIVEIPPDYIFKKPDNCISSNILNDNHKQFMEKTFLNFYNKYGFLVIKNLFTKDTIQSITQQAQQIFKTQMVSLGLVESIDMDNPCFETNMKLLFDNHNQIFFNCAKHCQYIIDLWNLALKQDIIHIIKVLGITTPIISTRPILFSNSKHISKGDIFHTVPPHQDWATMQGSINSIVCWLPLIDSTQDLGCIAFVPESHKLGLIMDYKVEGFGLVTRFNNPDFVSLDLKQGDSLFFSSFLVHKSGNNITDSIRWSTHFRYNDLDEKTFIENGYPHAFIYKSIDEILKPEFDTATAAKDYFIKNTDT